MFDFYILLFDIEIVDLDISYSAEFTAERNE